MGKHLWIWKIVYRIPGTAQTSPDTSRREQSIVYAWAASQRGSYLLSEVKSQC
jgi:hypothetical protein